MGENSSKFNKGFEKAFEAAAKNKRNFYIYKGVSNLNSEINKSVKAVEKDKKKKYIKSDSYVKWVSEKEKNTCEACRSKDGRIYKANELKGIWPVHPNCKCELVDILAINSEAIETNLLSGIGKSDIIKSERLIEFVMFYGDIYKNANNKLPEKEGRIYYKFKTNKNEFIIVSNDGLKFMAVNNFKTLYPIESVFENQKALKQKEESFMASFEEEMEIFEKNEMAPMAYTYIMKNIYDWYLSDSTAQRAMLEQMAEGI
jgi:hypothetical protein